jgi:uncharacterized protein
LRFVLDSWAVLRLLEGSEPAAARVQDILDHHKPTMSWINAGEVFYVVCRDQGEDEARQVIRDLAASADLELPTERRVLEAARLKADHRMSYADAFAAATAVARGATLLTGDPELITGDAPWRYQDLRH